MLIFVLFLKIIKSLKWGVFKRKGDFFILFIFLWVGFGLIVSCIVLVVSLIFVSNYLSRFVVRRNVFEIGLWGVLFLLVIRNGG